MRKFAKHVACLALVAVGSAAVLTSASPALAQAYPAAPVRVLSGFPAGTTADITARVVGAKMGQILGQQFFVENRPGAASSIAGTQAARAPNDGYTLYVSSAANMINAAMRTTDLPFDIHAWNTLPYARGQTHGLVQPLAARLRAALHLP